MANSRFVYVTYIRTTPEKLWRAMTEPEFTRKVWCGTVQECDWKVGSSWKIVVPDGRVADSGKVLEIEPFKRLVLSWQNHLKPEMTAEGFSRMTYELEPMGDVVKFTLVHEIERPESKLIGAVSTGWPMILASVKSLLETGTELEATRTWPKGL
jgi:uncharacterized protein YndB with AHSA1/START domain